jgi:hypothetical protein
VGTKVSPVCIDRVGKHVDEVSFLMGVEDGRPGKGESDCRIVE